MNVSDFVNELKGCHLRHFYKDPRFDDLYGFIFAKTDNHVEDQLTMCEYILHIMCRFKVIWRKARKTKIYHEGTPSEVFYNDFKELLGLKIICVGLSSKNDLWLTLDRDIRIVFATLDEPEDEGSDSWCLFTRNRTGPFLMVSNTTAQFVE